MGHLRGAANRGFAGLLFALAVSPMTAPFSAVDWQLALHGPAPHEGASLKVKAPDHQPVASASTVSRSEPVVDETSRPDGPRLKPGRERLPVDPPLRL
jgi:hypothetical protein